MPFDQSPLVQFEVHDPQAVLLVAPLRVENSARSCLGGDAFLEHTCPTRGSVKWETGQIVNEEIIRAGFAWVYHTYCKKPVCLEWKREEDEARAAKQGLWTDKSPVPPWEWRKAATRH